MKTQLIAAWKKVLVKGREMFIVTTDQGESVWCTDKQFDSNAETITFKPMKKGDKYKNSKGEDAELQADRNEFTGCGKQIVKKFNTVELFGELQKMGITPAVNV